MQYLYLRVTSWMRPQFTNICIILAPMGPVLTAIPVQYHTLLFQCPYSTSISVSLFQGVSYSVTCEMFGKRVPLTPAIALLFTCITRALLGSGPCLGLLWPHHCTNTEQKDWSLSQGAYNLHRRQETTNGYRPMGECKKTVRQY